MLVVVVAVIVAGLVVLYLTILLCVSLRPNEKARGNENKMKYTRQQTHTKRFDAAVSCALSSDFSEAFADEHTGHTSSGPAPPAAGAIFRDRTTVYGRCATVKARLQARVLVLCCAHKTHLLQCAQDQSMDFVISI